MAKILDRILLFIYSLSIGIISVIAILLITNAVPVSIDSNTEAQLLVAVLVIAVLLFLLSIRFFYVSVRRDRSSLPSIDQRTEFGDIQISVETIENLSYKAASRVRGVRDVKTRIRVSESGLEINVRALVDGETAIPPLTEEVQKQVHDQVEEITGIPVSYVSVYIANLVQSPVMKSRVE
ncbi:alkaline shock response membrane anchor protein AmaP [Paenibacillus pinistramenti]|uniref:alkaline shock response membrane anchor protein AmaP n=1 Tax=Paenibacillus pinistramenti TaxID=1768003 RepID=UPI0011080485|nr:alkaline shock response membrane anchor protein AmaP [Paenibacillus pinistramenti]